MGPFVKQTVVGRLAYRYTLVRLAVISGAFCVESVMRSVTVSLALLLVGGLAHGQSPREVIERGKAATALVEVDVNKSASATCIHKQGIFVTNRHVIDKLPKDGKLKLILHPNDARKRQIMASVLRVDDKADLAVLRAEGAGECEFLPLGEDAELFETMSVTAFGFPFGKALAVGEGSYPDISVNVGRITSLRKTDGKLQQIQLDAQLNPGNSGGPVLDDKGRVVGIVQSGVFATGVNFAVPVSKVLAVTQRPEVVVKLPALDKTTMHGEVEFRFEVVPLFGTLGDVAVELELQPEDGPLRKLAANKDAGGFLVRTVPFLPPAEKQPVRLSSKVAFSKGSLQGELIDQEFQIGDQRLLLSDVRSLETGPESKAVKHDGTELAGPLRGLDQVRCELGGYDLQLDLSRAGRVALERPVQPEPALTYSVIVTYDNSLKHRIDGRLGLGGVVPGGAASGVSFVPYKGLRQQLELPDLVADVAVGRGGQLLLLYLQKTRKIAVYDVNQAKIVKYLPVSADNALLAAGMDTLIVLASSENVIEHWSLTTLTRDKAQVFPLKGVVKCLALGSASYGPLLVNHADGTDALARAHYTFLDLQTLQPVKVAANSPHNSSYRDAVHIRAAATGDLFGLWATSHSPQGLETIALEGGNVKVRYQHDSAGHVVPNFDGSAVLTGYQGVCTPELNQRGRRGQSMPCVPSTHPRFYVSFPTEPGAQINLGTKPFAGRKASISVIDSDQPLADLPDLELGDNRGNASWSANDFTIDKRVHFIMQANQLVTIPFTNDRLIVQPFNLRETLDKAGLEYFYISTMPGRQFVPGKTFRYAAAAESSKAGVQFELSSGPEGMKMSAAGDLVWDVPADFKPENASVLITAKLPDGKTMHQTFTLRAQKS